MPFNDTRNSHENALLYTAAPWLFSTDEKPGGGFLCLSRHERISSLEMALHHKTKLVVRRIGSCCWCWGHCQTQKSLIRDPRHKCVWRDHTRSLVCRQEIGYTQSVNYGRVFVGRHLKNVALHRERWYPVSLIYICRSDAFRIKSFWYSALSKTLARSAGL